MVSRRSIEAEIWRVVDRGAVDGDGTEREEGGDDGADVGAAD